MNLVQLMELAAQDASVELIGAQHTPHTDPEMRVVYMKDEVDLTSQLAFFDFEQIPPTLFIAIDGEH